jgi:hypothetical protein
MIPLLAPLPEIVLRIRDAVAAAVCAVLRVVRVARALIVCVAVLISLDMVPVLLRLSLSTVALLCARPLVVLLRLLVVLLLVKALAEARMRLRLRFLPAGTVDTGRTPRTGAVVAATGVAAVDVVAVAVAGALSFAPAASPALPAWSCQSVSAGAFAGPWRGTST